MTYDVVMPQLGLTMEEGSVVSWGKQAGDWVEKGEVLFTVETDKVEMEVESRAALGRLLNGRPVRVTLRDQFGDEEPPNGVVDVDPSAASVSP